MGSVRRAWTFALTLIGETAAIVVLTLVTGPLVSAVVEKANPSAFSRWGAAEFTLHNGEVVTATTPQEVERLRSRYVGQTQSVVFHERSDARALTREEITTTVGFVLLAVYVLLRERQKLSAWFRTGTAGFLLALIAAVVGYLLQVVYIVALTRIFDRGHGMTGLMPTFPALTVALIVFFAPVSEELYFRGRMYDMGIPAVGRVWTWALITALFALAHDLPALPLALRQGSLAGVLALGLQALVKLPCFVIISIVFLWLRERTGTVLAPIVAHSALNTLLLVDLPGRIWGL